MSIEVPKCQVCGNGESCTECGDRQVCNDWFEAIGMNSDEPYPYLY